MNKTVVAIVGRKNVGKSTLLNRMTGKRISIVEDLPGTTRDRIISDISWQGKIFTLIDTGGFEFETTTKIAGEINKQIFLAIGEAEIIIFLVDARDGILPDDLEIANQLRRMNKTVLLAVNKADNTSQESFIADFYQLGLGEPIPVSAYHGRGVAELMDKIVELIPEPNPDTHIPNGIIKVAIVGKPNVGKSTLLNALIKEERAIVDSTPGTTRDAIDTPIDFQGQNMLLIDTAGIKRQGKIEPGVERYSVIRSMEAIERSDVVLLVFDASELISAQDTHIAGYVREAAKGIILVGNKCDLKNSAKGVEYNYVKQQFNFIPYAPLLYISAKTQQGVDQLMPCVIDVYRERIKRLPTNTVNDIIRKAVAAHTLPQKSGRHLNVLYATQAGINPPTFVFSVNDPKLVHFSYKRYLENKLRDSFAFTGNPIRLLFKPRSES
jgi:GTPase